MFIRHPCTCGLALPVNGSNRSSLPALTLQRARGTDNTGPTGPLSRPPSPPLATALPVLLRGLVIPGVAVQQHLLEQLVQLQQPLVRRTPGATLGVR